MGFLNEKGLAGPPGKAQIGIQETLLRQRFTRVLDAFAHALDCFANSLAAGFDILAGTLKGVAPGKGCQDQECRCVFHSMSFQKILVVFARAG